MDLFTRPEGILTGTDNWLYKNNEEVHKVFKVQWQQTSSTLEVCGRLCLDIFLLPVCAQVHSVEVKWVRCHHLYKF